MRTTILLIGIFSVASVVAQNTSATSAATDGSSTSETVSERAKHPLRKGSFLQLGVGAGYSELQYQLTGGSIAPVMPSFTANLGYAYYFLPWLGIGTGVGFGSYGTTATLTDELVWNGILDSENDSYNHHVKLGSFTESQLAYLAEIPLAFHFKHNFGGKVGLFAALGAKVALPVYAKYTVKTGEVEHYGYYPQWDLTLQNLPGRFETESYAGQTGRLYSGLDKQSVSHFATVNYFGYAELGMLIQLSRRTDLLIGVYGNYGFNNMHHLSETEKRDLGFATVANGYDFMEEYAGLIGTKAVGEIHPWSGGVKVGLNIYLGKLEKKKPEEPKPQIVYVRDTVYIRDTITIPGDTVVRVQKVEIPSKADTQLDNLLKKAVIWFHFDEYTPILEPQYILDSVADVLRRHSGTLIAVNGHACKIGTDEYNQRLAMRRAHAVADLLRKKGVSDTQMVITSYGSNHPFRYNGEHQLKRDRRVEIIPLGCVPQLDENDYIGYCPGGKDSIAYSVKPVVDNMGTPVYQKYESFQGEEILKPGSRLAQIARRWYQIPEFWVYIYEANADRIADPNNVLPGITIMIPRLESIMAGRDMETVMQEALELKKKYVR